MFSFYSDKTLTREKLNSDIKVLESRIDTLEKDIVSIKKQHEQDIQKLHEEIEQLKDLFTNNARTRNMIIRSYSTKSNLVSKFIPDE